MLTSSIVLEHDSSLSRNDIYFGDNHSFNQTIWDQTTTHFPNPTISFVDAAAARSARLAAATAANPEFNMTAAEQQNSYIESALYMGTFGDITTGNAVKEWVEVLFSEFVFACSICDPCSYSCRAGTTPVSRGME